MGIGELSRRTTAIEEDTPETGDTDLSDVIQNSFEVLKTLRHEIRADLELATQDVRRHWARLEARLHAAEIRARDRSRGSARHLAELVDDALQFRGRLRRARTGASIL